MFAYCIKSHAQTVVSKKESDIENKTLETEIVDHSGVQSLIEKHKIISTSKPAFYDGFRIQIINTNNKEDAMKIKSDFYSKFPDMRCYTVYQQPYYKVRVGDYPTQESAKNDLKKLAKFYPSSFLVSEQIRRTIEEDERLK
jgi:hypothetical protein